MTDFLTIALAQKNPIVGDVKSNLAKMREARSLAAEKGADLVIATELCISGYPPEDLVLKRSFLEVVKDGVEELAKETADGGPGLIVGAPWFNDRGECYNSALVLDQGKILTRRDKYDLPNYGVFDEKRIFNPGLLSGPINYRGVRLGLAVCEDMWNTEVSETLQESGSEILVFINGSPYERDKVDMRLNLAVARVRETGLPLIYVNQVGGQDELVFDGGSFVLNSNQKMLASLPQFIEDVSITKWARDDKSGLWNCLEGSLTKQIEGVERIYQAMVLGLRDYVNKNKFPGVVIGLSGGIDSGITAVVAVDALGAERVHCVMIPSPFTSQDSLEDAEELAKRLGVRLDNINIEPAMQAFDKMLLQGIKEPSSGTTKENIQSLSLIHISEPTRPY